MSRWPLPGLAAAALVLGLGPAQSLTFAGEPTVGDAPTAAAQAARPSVDPTPGPLGVRQGFYGSLAVTGRDSSGASVNIGGSARLNYGAGYWTHSLGLRLGYGYVGGITTDQQAFLAYDLSRALTPRLYAFGTVAARWDDIGPRARDAWAGLGLGYRVIDTPGASWQLELAAGARATRDQAGATDSGPAVMAASRLSVDLTGHSFLTNDTDVVHSAAGTALTNELGVNYRVTDAVTTRLSLTTEYDSAPPPGTSATDHRFGLSVIYGF